MLFRPNRKFYSWSVRHSYFDAEMEGSALAKNLESDTKRTKKRKRNFSQKKDVGTREMGRTNTELKKSTKKVVTFGESEHGSEHDNNKKIDQCQEEIRGNGSNLKTRNSKEEKRKQLLLQRKKLPIWTEREVIIDAVKENDIVIVEGETGSGKTTQIPQFLHEAGFTSNGILAITQPRRVAAINLSKHVADEMGTTLGKLVGYSIRFEDVSSETTLIKYVTDGMLLRELLSDALLLRYNVIILDEAHERSLRTDILMGMIKQIVRKRKEHSTQLKVVIMSATLDAERFSQFFNNAPVIKVSGRQFPVKILYSAEPKKDYIEACFRAIMQIHLETDPGDILVFLTGQDDIESLDSVLQMYTEKLEEKEGKILTCPIFAALPSHQQAKVFQKAPPNTRKVILATNIAETSITISGVRYVIDTGLCKMRGYSSNLGIESLLVQPISKSSARQRAGRAGREAPGTCFRLYTEKDYLKLEENTLPEIQRCDLSFAILSLKASGVENIIDFEFMDKPDIQTIKRALLQLYALGALDNNGNITELGQIMVKFPISPQFSKVLITSKQHGCTSEVIDIISILSTDGNIFYTPNEKKEKVIECRKKFAHRDGDHLTLLNVLRGYLEQSIMERTEWCHNMFINSRVMKNILDIRKQLVSFCTRYEFDPLISCKNETDSILKCFLQGFFQNIALLQPDKSYKSIMGHQEVKIHPSSIMMNRKVEAIMYNELIYTTRQYVRGVSSIQSAWLSTSAPRLYNNIHL